MSACCNGLSCERPCEHGIHLDQQQCFLCELDRKIKALEDVDYDERIHDLENIGAESRLLELEKNISSLASISLIHSSNHVHETWKAGCEVLIKEIQKQIDEINNGLIKRIGILGEALHTLSGENHKLRKKPHKCPVCDGLGEDRLERNGMLLSFPPKWPNCKPCKGEGIVWG